MFPGEGRAEEAPTTFPNSYVLITSVEIVLVFLVVFHRLVPPLTLDGSARGGGTQDHTAQAELLWPRGHSQRRTWTTDA